MKNFLVVGPLLFAGLWMFYKLFGTDKEEPMSETSSSRPPDSIPGIVPVFKYANHKSAGLRSNNPGNLRTSAVIYKGEIKGTRVGFRTFVTIEYGYRAVFTLLKYYYEKLGIKTINGMISRYAPSHENDTTGYVRHVSTYVGLPATNDLTLDRNTMVRLVTAISKMENGVTPDPTEIARGYELFLKG